MLPLRLLALCALSLVACGPADGQASADADDRRQRIVANLQLEIPALRDATVEVAELEDGDIAGLDRGTFTVNGQPYPFFVTEDGTRLLLLAADPVDISRSAETVQAALAEEGAEAAREAAERGTALAEATRGLPARGPADAPVTVVEFSDFQCPYCARASGTVEALLDRYPDRVRLVYAHFPLGNHAWARPAAIAATCAAEQDPGAFWALHDLYFREQAGLSPQTVVDRSRTALAGSGVDLARWEACAADTGSEAYQQTAAAVDAQMALGEEYGVRGTPAFFVNGQMLSGAQPLGAFTEAVEAALAVQR